MFVHTVDFVARGKVEGRKLKLAAEGKIICLLRVAWVAANSATP